MPQTLCERSPFGLIEPDDTGWPLERAAFRLLQLMLVTCLFWWVIDSREILELKALYRRERDVFTARYQLQALKLRKRYDFWRARWVVATSLFLFLLWLLDPACTGLRIVFAGLAISRLLEILTTGLGTSLAQSQQIRARNLMTIAAYALQCILIFAILYHSLAAGHFELDKGEPATGRLDYLYASWSNFTSLGSAYEPHGGVARYLTVSTTTVGIILLGVLLAFGINAVKSGERPSAIGLR